MPITNTDMNEPSEVYEEKQPKQLPSNLYKSNMSDDATSEEN